MEKNILITGGAGYIGSHTVLQLLLGGFRAVVVDNLDNSSEVAIDRVRELADEFGNNLVFHKVITLLFFFFQLFLFLFFVPTLGVGELLRQIEIFDRLLGFLFVSDFKI